MPYRADRPISIKIEIIDWLSDAS